MSWIRKNIERLQWALKPASQKKRLLDDAIRLLEVFPDTRDLLDLAKAEGITISFSSELIGSGTNGHVRRQINEGKSYIELLPRDTPEQVAATLIHELRHVWQNKTMGASATSTAREESSAEMNALITRVREADAYAFTAGMIEQINFACGILTDAVRIAKDMMRKNPDMQLGERDISNIGQMLILSRKDAPPDLNKTMTDTFNKMLPRLDHYDRTSLKRYHALYTHPDFKPHTHAPANDAIDIPKLRQILKCGVTPAAPAYLSDLDDKAFSALVLKDISPAIRDSFTLITAFEAAAAKGGLSANDNRDMREVIHEKVRKAQVVPKSSVTAYQGITRK